jgi:hypothetical protein
MTRISVVITTLNEEPNIARAIESARRLSDDILVVDSGSVDRTPEIASRHGARVMTRPFDDMARQRNAALEGGQLRGGYALFMDADEMLTEAFARALERALEADPGIDGVRICRRFHLWGVWVPAASSFPHFIARVARVGKVTFRKEGHGEVFVGAAKVVDLEEPLHDEDLKGMRAWIERHAFYAEMEAREDLRILAGESAAPRLRRMRARLRRWPGWPVVPLLYYLVARRGLLEGRTGWTYCAMKAMYEYFIQLHVRELKRRGKGASEWHRA